jgi:hypothetical protein
MGKGEGKGEGSGQKGGGFGYSSGPRIVYVHYRTGRTYGYHSYASSTVCPCW